MTARQLTAPTAGGPPAVAAGGLPAPAAGDLRAPSARGPGRRAAAVVAAALLVALALPAVASAGTFRVSQCAAAESGAPADIQADLWSVSNGWMSSSCGAPGGRLTFDAGNHRLAHLSEVDARLTLPASMPGTAARAVWLDWRSMPQSESTNPAYLLLWAGGSRILDVPTGWGTAPGLPQRLAVPSGARQLLFQTWCSPANGPGWCNWPVYLLELRALTLELEEDGEPAASASGPLLEGGAQAGVQPLEVAASDADSGVRSLSVTLGGAPAGTVEVACRSDRLPPCPQALRRTLDVDTTRIVDGAQRLRVTVTDAAGNQRMLDAGLVRVANQPPLPAPTPTPVPLPTATPVPAAVPAAGSAPQAQRPPPGATAPAPAATPPAPAGPRPRRRIPNGRNASRWARISVWLERGGRRVAAVTLRPGIRVRIRGRVTDELGRPIGGASLGLVETIDGLPRVATGVRTRGDGRFTTFTRLGPSRTLRFTYRPFRGSRHTTYSRALRVRVLRR